jgi:hypothetical protein
MHNMIAILKDHHPDELGLLPDFIDQSDPRPAREQFDAAYAHGGGWRPIKGFTQGRNEDGRPGIVLRYPGDPPFHPIATWPLRHELIVVYRHGIVAVFNTQDGTFQVARLD